MAEETKNKVFYLGLEYDLDALDFIGLNAEAYARHQNLNDVQRNAFMQEVNARLANMRGGGDGSLSDNNSIVYTGAFTGSLKKGPKAWNGITRNGFSPRDLADSYLMGGFGRYNSLTAKRRAAAEAEAEAAAAAKQAAWKPHIGNGDSTLGERLRNLWGNDLDMTHWADSAGDVLVNGVRSRSGRYGQLNLLLKTYRDDLNSGKFGNVADSEDMQRELALLDGVLNNGDVSQLDSAYARLLGNDLFDKLMFTGERYMSPQEQELARVQGLQDERAKALLDYINGVEGSKNPYEPGTEEYKAAEMRRQDADDNRFNQRFGKESFTNPEDFEFSTIITDSLDPSVFSGWNSEEMRRNLDAMYGAGANASGYDRSVGNFRGEWGHDEKAGWNGDFWGGSDTSLAGTMYDPYLDALALGNDDLLPDDYHMTLSSSENNARSTNAVKAKATMDYARHLISLEDHKMFQTRDGYVLPEFIDWNTGSAYLFNFNPGDRRGRAKRVNINNIINSIDPNSQMYKALMNEWRKHHGKAALNKLGGVLKAQNGAPLSDKELSLLREPTSLEATTNPRYNLGYLGFLGTYNAKTPELLQAELDARYAMALENGVSEQTLMDRNASTEFSNTDYARIGTAIADLTGAVLSLSGFSPAGAAVGAASTLTLFGLDMADGDVGFTDALKALGIGLALDAASLIPGNGASGLMKAVKGLSKYAVPIISAMQVAGNSPEAIATAKKVFSGNIKGITVGEWKGFARALNGLTNATPMAKVAYSKRWGELSKLKKPQGEQSWTFKINGKEATLTQELIKNINNSADPAAAFKAQFKGLTDADDVSGFIETPNAIKSKLFKSKGLLDLSQGTEGVIANANEYRLYYSRLKALERRRNALINKGNKRLNPNASLWERARAKMVEKNLDDAAYLFGGKQGLLNEQKMAAKKVRELDDAQAKAQIEALDLMLAEGNLTPTDVAAIRQQRQNALDQLAITQRDFAAAGGDAGITNAEKVVTDLEKAIVDKGKLDKLVSELESALESLRAKFGERNPIRKILKLQTKEQKQVLDRINEIKKDLTTATDPAEVAKLNAELAKSQARADELTTLIKDNQTQEAKVRSWINFYMKAAQQKKTVADTARALLESLLNPHGLNSTSDLQAAKASKLDYVKKLKRMKKRSAVNPATIDSVFADPAMLTNAADVKYLDALVNSGLVAAKDVAKFLVMLLDLASKGYTDDQIMAILQNLGLIDKVRGIYNFKKGGYIRKFDSGGATLTSNALPLINLAKKAGNFIDNGLITGLEIKKFKDTLGSNRKAMDLLKSVPALDLSYTPINYKVSTGNVSSPYERAAAKLISEATDASNRYSTAETLLAGKLAGAKAAEDYNVQGATLTSLKLDLELAKLQETKNANIKARTALDNQEAQLQNSKRLSDANNEAIFLKDANDKANIFYLTWQRSHAEASNANRLAKISLLVMDDPEYQLAYDDYMDAYTTYKNNPNDATAKEASLVAAKHLKTVRSNITSRLNSMYPQLPTGPFGFVRGVTPYQGDFWSTTSFKEGGSIGKLTLAELVKLFRQQQTEKLKEKQAYLKLLNLYAERSSKGKVSPAYLAYLKLVNSKL